MKRLGPWIACAWVLAINAFVLMGVAHNRGGPPGEVFELTERELPKARSGDEDTGVALRIVPTMTPWQIDVLDRDALEGLGFDCSAPPHAKEADFHYDKQLPRRGYLALEYDGDAWRDWLAEKKREAEERNGDVDREDSFLYGGDPVEDHESLRLSHSRLVPIDAGPDPVALRARQPDPDRILILPAVFRIRVERPWDLDTGKPGAPELRGHVQDILIDTVHVPPKHAAPFRALPPGWHPRMDADPFEEPEAFEPRYRVRLRTGRRHEPWVDSIELVDRAGADATTTVPGPEGSRTR